MTCRDCVDTVDQSLDNFDILHVESIAFQGSTVT
jgi:hypothetical protein